MSGLKSVIVVQVSGLVDFGVRKREAERLVKQMIARLKRTQTEQEIVEYFELLQDDTTNEEAKKLPIHKIVSEICIELANENPLPTVLKRK